MSSSERPRSAGVTYAVLTVLLIVLIAAIALSSRQAPPPTIAEFAPQAVESISDAPSDQSSSAGRAGGIGPGSGAGTPTATPEPSTAPIDVARVRRCVGDPPRQIEDPQSPPCVPYWSGDNGGATSKGVTRDQVRIVIPRATGTSVQYCAFFNLRLEFYGRRLTCIPTSDAADPAAQRANAVDAEQKHHAFASAHATAGGGFDYYEELAHQKIIGAEYFNSMPEAGLAVRHPYRWTYAMAPDREMTMLGEWACTPLAGRNAAHAGTSDVFDMSTRTRSFGVIFTSFQGDGVINADPLVRRMNACGAPPAKVIEGSDIGADQQRTTNIMLQMKQANVTSIFLLVTNVFSAGFLAKSGTSQAYFPEWLASTYSSFDNDFEERFGDFPANHRAHLFGLTMHPRQLRIENEPFFWALKEGNPALTSAQEQNAAGGAANEFIDYRTMLLLASGVQMAGPRLTPSSFALGLQRHAFPNPDTPAKAGSVGFRDGDHTMTDDAAEWWWSNTEPSPYPDNGAGTICYVDGAARRRPGGFPDTGDVFFSGPCDSIA